MSFALASPLLSLLQFVHRFSFQVSMVWLRLGQGLTVRVPRWRFDTHAELLQSALFLYDVQRILVA